MKGMLVGLVFCLVLTGCEALPFARELESTMLVQVLGVDWTDGGVTLTAASDPDTGAKVPLLSASGRDLDEAKRALVAAGEEYVSLTHVTQVVLGADSDCRAVLEAALKEPALGQSATVWLARDCSAKELLEATEGGAARLSSIELNSGVVPMSVLKGLMTLEETGQVELPVLTAKNDKLEWEGEAVCGA